MVPEGFKRKLTAILSADAVGYSRLMAEDEAATVKTIATCREIMSSLIKQHRGRVVDSPGDNVLAEFSSVVDAVQCAVAVQDEFQTRNAKLAENCRMEFRIGINLGDVIEEEDRIYGDGVNIAARLESLADPGGICVSKTAFDQIETKLPLGYEYLGEQSVKNIPKPVSAYRVLMKPDAVGKVIGEKIFLGRFSRRTAMAAIVILVVIAAGLVSWNIYLQQSSKIEPASAEKMAFPLPDKPSIAVLPFENLSGDPKQEYFSDGLTEEIITGLSKVPYLFVIARNSSFTYKGKPVKIRQVAEELGVRYVLEGSFRKDEDKIRVTAQLIDAITGYHLWAERYDRELKNIFSLQDEITMKIMKSLEIRLTEGEQARLDRKGTKNLEAYVKVLQAIDYFRRFNKDDNLLARREAEEAIALDPQYARAFNILGWTYLMDIFYGTSKSPAKSMERAEELAQKALSLDESLALIRQLTSYIYLLKRQHDKAVEEAERGFALDPNAADILAHLAMALSYFGRPEVAIEFFKKAIRLNPFPPTFYFHNLGRTYRHLGRYEEAITEVKKALKRSPKNLFAHVELVAAYSLSGRDGESQSAGEEILKIQPNFTAEGFAKKLPYKNKADTDRLIAALHKAGLK